ncbi:hypothetical protein M9Y10_006472 [Tritrichomonas musculus]|uniref:DUF4201 domain-containing protein n=1 Tax=Tritrichomonas musculus TaxID=1915356 RepID=A0ABR2JGC5_9EUKA
MENIEPNSQIFDRKVKYCQFRIQEAICLHDDEINRFTNRLNQYKALIHETKEKIDNLSRQIEEESESKQGERKRRQAELNVGIARIKASHHQSLQDLQKKQAEEIELIQQDFENSLNTLKQTSSFQSTKKIQEVESEIQKVQTQIETYKKETAKVEKQSIIIEHSNNEQYDGINLAVIDQLQQIIKTRSEERYKSLRQSREKLATCVETIEGMIRKHTIQVGELQNKLHELDEQYETDFQRLEDDQEYTLRSLKSHLLEAQKRTNRLLNAAKKLDYENQKQLRETIKDLEGMKQKCYTISEDVSGIDEQRMNQLKSLRSELPKLKRYQKKLDEILDDKRAENEELRRDIGKFRHMLRFGVNPGEVIE